MTKTLRAGGALLGLLFSLAFCVSIASAVTELGISPATVTVRSNESVTFAVTKTVNGTATDATTEAVFSTNDPAGTIQGASYFGGSAGEWTVVASIAESAVTANVTVTPGEVTRLLIAPHDEVVRVEIGKTLQFNTTAYDNFNNIVKDPALKWSGVYSIGTVSDSGLFSASKIGSSQIIATSGQIIDTVTVTVFSPNTPEIATSTDGNATKETNVTNTETTPPTDVALTTDETAATNTASCATMPWWGWLGATTGFLALVYGYHYVIRKQRAAVWLLGTAALTGIALWLYFAYRCGNQFTWVAWIVSIGACILAVLRPQTFQTNYGSEL